jgi:hypothetical protein
MSDKNVRHITQDMLTQDESGAWRLNTEINPRTILAGNTLDRIAVQTLQYRDDAVARGTAFYSYWETPSIPVGGKVYAKFICPPDRFVGVLFREVTTDKERLFYRVYTGFSNATAGTDIRRSNLRASSINSSTSQFNIVTTVPVLTGATEVTILPLFGAVGSGNRASGSLVSNNVFRLLPPNSEFLIELENLSADPCYCLVELNWLELPENVIPGELPLP